MKRLITSVCLIVSLFVISCRFQIPEKISVKTNAEYKLNVGSINKDLGESINVKDFLYEEEIRKAIPNAQVFDYFPNQRNANVQQFLLKLPLMNIPIDVGNYFESSDLSFALQDFSFEKEITIPSVNLSQKQEVDSDVVSEVLNKTFSFYGKVVNGQATFAADFNSIEYDNLTLVINGPGEAPIADGVTVTITNGTNDGSGVFSGNVAEVNLGAFTFTKDNLLINFSIQDTEHSYIGTIKDGSKIRKASGVSYPSTNVPEVTDKMEYSLSETITIPSSFDSATVGEGNLLAKINIPWSGVNVSYGLIINGAGLDINVSESNSDKNINLKDKTLTPGDITVSSTAVLTFSNAIIDFTKKPSFEVSTNIQSFKHVTIDVDNVGTTLSKEDSFPKEVYETVKGVKLSSSGVKGKYTNTFPNGNDITLTANSGFFGITNKDVVLSGGSSNKPFTLMSEGERDVNLVSLENHKPEDTEYGKWDFNINIGLPGTMPGTPNRVTLQNVKPNATYKFGIELTPELNWKEVTIQPPSTLSTSETKKLGVSFSSLFTDFSETIGIENFAQKIKLKSLPIYLYAEKPNMNSSFDSIKFLSYVSLFYGKENGSSVDVINDDEGDPLKVDLVGSKISPTELTFKPSSPELDTLNNVVISDISEYDCSAKTDIASILNASFTKSEGDIYIDYSVELSGGSGEGITISKADMENSSSGSIAVTAYIVLPLEFMVSNGDDPLEFDLDKILKSDGSSDLFGRSEAESVGGNEISDYTQVIQSCGLKYETNALPFYSYPSMEVLININPNNPLCTPKKLQVDGDTMMVNSNEINSIFADSSYPYRPEVKFSIPKGARFSLQRDILIDMNVELMVITDGSINLLGGE